MIDEKEAKDCWEECSACQCYKKELQLFKAIQALNVYARMDGFKYFAQKALDQIQAIQTEEYFNDDKESGTF